MSEAGRGGGWVVAQFALLGVVVGALALGPRWPVGARVPLAALGIVLALAGAAIAVWAGRTLGAALTPFPRPAEGAELAVGGPYAYVRHPIYAGGLIFCCGWSLVASPAALLPTAALAAVWVGKAAVEERRLRERFPGYDDYARRVRFRLLPGVL